MHFFFLWPVIHTLIRSTSLPFAFSLRYRKGREEEAEEERERDTHYSLLKIHTAVPLTVLASSLLCFFLLFIFVFDRLIDFSFEEYLMYSSYLMDGKKKREAHPFLRIRMRRM